MNEVRLLDALEMDLTLESGAVSTARLTLMPEESLAPFDWVRVYAPNGDAGIFRVCGIETDYETGITAVLLRHGLCALEDALFPDEDITLDDTAQNVFRQLLDRQTQKDGYGHPLWQAGSVAIADRLTMEAGSLAVLDGITQALSEYPDYVLVTDQTTHPWTLKVRALPETPQAEGRLARNLSALRIERTTENLCTRVVSAKLAGGRLDGETGRWGVRCRHLSIPEDDQDASALAAARRFLTNRAEPAVSMTMTAAELREATGEAWDTFHAGDAMRLALPDGAVLQRITTVRYPSAFGDPERAEITLANRPQTVWLNLVRLQKLAEQTERAEKRTRSTSKSNKRTLNSHTELIALKAEKTEVTELGTRISQAEVRIDGANAQIALKASQTEVTDLRSRISAAGITVDGSVAQVKLLATKSELDTLTSRVSSAEASIEVNADNISSKVSQTDYTGKKIASLINQSASSVIIQAEHIDLDGYVTAGQLSTTNAKITNLINGTTTASKLRCTEFWLAGYQCYLANGYVRYGSGD